jgi:hypothetical protein
LWQRPLKFGYGRNRSAAAETLEIGRATLWRNGIEQ